MDEEREKKSLIKKISAIECDAGSVYGAVLEGNRGVNCQSADSPIDPISFDFFVVAEVTYLALRESFLPRCSLG